MFSVAAGEIWSACRAGAAGRRAAVRHRTDSPWRTWRRFFSTANTTADRSHKNDRDIAYGPCV